VTLQLGIIGTGRIAHAHAAAARDTGGVQLAAAIDVDPAAARAFAEQWGCSWWGTSLQDAPDELDAVIVSSPTALHREHALRAIERGCSVLVEKPFARDVSEAEDIIAAAEERGVVVTGGQVLRFLPVFSWARQAIADGVLGRPVQAIERRLVDRPDNFPWWSELPTFLISHWGSHSIDLLCDLLGERAVEVYCQADSIRSAFGVVDDFSMQLKFESGMRATSVMSFSSRYVVHDLVLIGTDATLTFDGYRSVALNGDVVFELPEDEMLARGFEAQLADFVAAIAGTPSLASGASVLPGLAALAAAERSALGAGVVRL
jgi:2-hydroxy-4-carboxymuconate semialdehyde hemiacetal dehydrogenase